MAWIPDALKEVHEQVALGQSPTVTVRKLLGWFHSERRGSRVVSMIHAALRELSMGTRPNFEDAWIDGAVTFFSLTEVARGSVVPPALDANPAVEQPPQQATVPELPPGEVVVPPLQMPQPLPEVPLQQALNVRHDPVFRLGKLAAANREPITVHPDSPVSKAVTVMMMHDFSQLPVVSSPSRVEGAISWKSLAQAYSLRGQPALVRDCMAFAPIYSVDDSVFEALGEMTQYGFVLVTARRKLQGIVTLVDVAGEFRGSFEPFVLIGEIERHLRQLIDRAIPVEIVRDVCAVAEGKSIDSAADLSFGQYLRLLEREDVWKLCELVGVDRVELIKELDRIREIRNEMMHFQSEAVDSKDLQQIREMAVFLREVFR